MSVTIFSALAEGSEKLRQAFGEASAHHNPKLDAQVLLAYCLQESTAYLFAHGDEVLSTAVALQYSGFIERRAAHEPVAYILGQKDFFGRTFKVTPATLVPRPETELLVELAKAEIENGTLVVDVGTGSGAIAVTLAAETEAEVIAIDVSHSALVAAHENAVTHQVDEQVAFLEGNLLKPFIALSAEWTPEAKPRHLLITANLPYLTERQWQDADDDVKKFEPKTALVGGWDGLALYDELFMQLAARRRELPERISLLCEIDPSQASAFQSLVRRYLPDARQELFRDLAGRARIMKAVV